MARVSVAGLRGLLLRFGITEPAGLDHRGKAAIEEVGQLSLSPGADMTRDSLLRNLAFLIQEREAVEEMLRRACRAPSTKNGSRPSRRCPAWERS